MVDETKRGRGVTIPAPVDQTEWLGSEQYAYVLFDPDPEVQAKLDELDRDLDGEGMRSQVVVALDPMSRVRAGETTDLWLDPRRVHVFDPETGDCLTRDEERGQADRRGQRDRAQAAARAVAATRGEQGPTGRR